MARSSFARGAAGLQDTGRARLRFHLRPARVALEVRVHVRHRGRAHQADRRRRTVAGVLGARHRSLARYRRDGHHGERRRSRPGRTSRCTVLAIPATRRSSAASISPRVATSPAGTCYSMDWTTDALVFKVDGAEEYRVTRPMVEKLWTVGLRQPEVPHRQSRARRAVSTSRQRHAQPYVGLPQSTVDLIAADKAVMVVDWVRVTR